MKSLKTQLLKFLLCFVLAFAMVINITLAQSCSGSWVSNNPLTFQCISGQQIGIGNSGNPIGCPINPTYSSNQTNTFIFDNPVNDFVIDFNAFSSNPGCARLQIKINGTFYPLTASNLMELPIGSNCTGSVNFIAVTTDGYITGGATSQVNTSGQGRIFFYNVNATSITLSTNDGGGGSVFASPCSPVVVPIKLKSFTGTGFGCEAILYWETGVEFNVKNIEVLRSTDGISFEKIVEVLPKGSNSHYTVETDHYSDAIFKLKINDLDGAFEYSKIIYLKSSCNEQVYSINPNPASNLVEVSGLTNNDCVLLSDMAGRTIRKFTYLQSNKFNIQNFAAGIYVVKVKNAGLVKATFKLIKL